MTFVVSRRFGERILVVSDTMITEETKLKNDTIPGALKAVIINGKLSIAYAGGSAEIALDAIRKLKLVCDAGGSLTSAITFLRGLVKEKYKSEQECEFIVVSHINGPEMFKIWEDGTVSEGKGVDQLWLGRDEPLRFINETERRDHSVSPIDFISSEERLFYSRRKLFCLETV